MVYTCDVAHWLTGSLIVVTGNQHLTVSKYREHARDLHTCQCAKGCPVYGMHVYPSNVYVKLLYACTFLRFRVVEYEARASSALAQALQEEERLTRTRQHVQEELDSIGAARAAAQVRFVHPRSSSGPTPIKEVDGNRKLPTLQSAFIFLYLFHLRDVIFVTVMQSPVASSFFHPEIQAIENLVMLHCRLIVRQWSQKR